MNNSPVLEATEWRKRVTRGETVGFVTENEAAPERGERNAMRPIFNRSCRGWKFFLTPQPTVSPWATFCRASGALVALISFLAASVTAEATNGLSAAEIQGRQLARQLCEARPAENFTNLGILKFKDAKGKSRDISVRFIAKIQPTNWVGIFQGINTATREADKLAIIHEPSLTNRYAVVHVCQNTTFAQLDLWRMETFSEADEKMVPFCGSDFSAADLGLEFFHWPEQKVLPKTTNLKRGRAYTLLESTNPDPGTNGYSRVVSWIDQETGGILEAAAYDAQGKLLKVFEPKSFKKVDGQWELQEMEIRNVQTGSRTRLEFDLKK